jgi:hypothetical protein
MSDTPPPDRFPYPRQLVVGVFHREEALERAVDGLRQNGFDPGAWEVLHGEDDARSLDPEGKEHGVGGALIRALQTVFSYEREHAREYAKRLRSGDYLLGVPVGYDEKAKLRAAEAMRRNGGDFIHYYADTNIESL